MMASKFFFTAVAILAAGMVQAGELVKVEMSVIAVGDPRGGKLQSNSTGCAEVRFTNRTNKKITVLTSPRPLGKGRVKNWHDASYVSPEGDGWGYLYDVPKVVIEFLGPNGKVVHRDGSIQMGSIQELDPDGGDSATILFSTPARPGVYTFRLVFDNTIMDRESGLNGSSGVPQNHFTMKARVQIPAVTVVSEKVEARDGEPAKTRVENY